METKYYRLSSFPQSADEPTPAVSHFSGRFQGARRTPAPAQGEASRHPPMPWERKMTTVRLQHLTSASIFVGMVACASAPSPGSLESIREQAARKAMEECLKTQFTTNRYIPLLTLAHACERAVYRTSSHRQPVAATGVRRTTGRQR